jgi:hypothetical protein
LLQLFRESLSTIYEHIIALDTAEVFQVPEDYFSALINEAVNIAGEQTTAKLDVGTQLFRIEFKRFTKTGGGVYNPFVTIE